MTLAAWLHDLDPFLIRFTPTFGVRWYGLSYVAGFLIAFGLLRWLAGRGAVLIPKERAADTVIFTAIAIVAGGRLGYALFYKPALFWTFEPSFPWWALVDLTQGGMASHGGIAGAILAAWRISRGWKTPDGQTIGRAPFLHIADAFALLAPAGLFLGRIANFVNGELLGRIIAMPGEPAPRWAVRFPQEVFTDHAPPWTLEQARRFQALLDTVALPGDSDIAAYDRLLHHIRAGRDAPAGPTAAELAEQLAPLLAARHPSQLYQALAEGLIVGAVVWFIARRPRLPGVVGCWFLISYGALRIATEFWRLPDPHLAVQRLAGLSRGQWLSALMVLAGAAALTVIVRRGGDRLGGWGKPRAGGSGPRP
jgi:phosphatidylglycerol---prolipoprotein diacylglyceryl transferase